MLLFGQYESHLPVLEANTINYNKNINSLNAYICSTTTIKTELK